MASFSFRAGNAAKLARVPLYIAGRAATGLIPRTDRWVFGCAVGVADGALALWKTAHAHGHDSVWLVASSTEQQQAAQHGIRTVRKNSWAGWWATARAGVIVVTHGLGDVNRFGTGRGFIVQLWHGIPLKKIGLDSAVTVDVPILSRFRWARAAMATLYRRTQAAIRILPAASHRARGRLESAFGLPYGRVVVTGEPRVDVLSAGSRDKRRTTAQKLLQRAVPQASQQRARRVLYAPTWRDGQIDPAVPNAGEWQRIAAFFQQHDAQLFIRPHPLGRGDYESALPLPGVHMLGSDAAPDVTVLLAAFDAVVTDYSSLLYDAGLLATPVVCFAPDAETYAATRGLYGTLAEVLAGREPARSWHDVLATLQTLWSEPSIEAEYARDSAELSAHMHAFRDGKNTERLYRVIVSRYGSAVQSPARWLSSRRRLTARGTA
ncbi:CDP-glycerol glycerophosphotransferase family protein [Microbacterium sp. YY-01]|uniref:CDP-glycerol glycerophosphotransferase family protein n=1 Tax=Microbacterium sp. YY-01 TaxID=3421634 RepID=UPI003D18161E